MNEQLRTDIEGCAAAHATLLRVIPAITAAQCREPSRLPGWTRAHVLTHLARNADSVTRRLDGARRDVIVDQYVGGAQGREREIEDGSSRDLDELLADVSRTAAEVDEAFASMPEQAWPRLSRAVSGRESPCSTLPFSRWREVEVHLVDLDIGYEPQDWPGSLAQRWLPELTRSLQERTDERQLLAWALNRGPAPELGAWG